MVDIKNAWLSPDIKREMMLSSRFAGKVKIAQFDKQTVRVVVESKVGSKNYNVFTLNNENSIPGRVVLDFGNIGSGTSSATINLPDVNRQKPAEEKPEPIIPEIPAPPTPTEEEKPEPIENEKPQSELDRGIAELTGLKGRIITIDPGHGGSDPGAIGPTGVTEKSVTLKIAMELQRLLKAEGATVYMTRTTDTEVSPKKDKATDVEELQARCDVANRHKADIFISIHMDSFSGGTAKGTTSYYYSLGTAKSRKLADKVRSALISQIGTQSRGTQSCNFYVVKHTDMPATLVEVAFISNAAEEKLLNSEAGVKKAALGIADGIADYFG